MAMRKFLLIGLPGAGKTTTMRAWVQFLNDQDIPANFVPTDTLINQRIRSDDPIIQQYEAKHGKISTNIFTSQDPSKAFIDQYGESALRSLEEALLVNMIESAAENDWLDFGGRALLLPRVIDAVKKQGIVIIFLSAKHETILSRLGENEEWRLRPTYQLAAEKSTDGKGWVANAVKHREERVEKFTKTADIIISVDFSEPTSVEDIVRTIDLRMKATERRDLFESYISKAMLEEALENESVKNLLEQMALDLHQKVMIPLKNAMYDLEWHELSPALQTAFTSYSMQHSEEDKALGALLPHEKQKKLKDSLEGRMQVLNAMEDCLLNARNYMTSINRFISLIKVIDGMAFSHDNGAHHNQRFSAKYSFIKEYVTPTVDETMIRTARTPKHLARSYGSMMRAGDDIVVDNAHVAGAFSGKARFVMNPSEKRFQDMFEQFETETDPQKLNNIEKKFDFYHIPKEQGQSSCASIYSNKYRTFFEKLATTKQGTVPLVAGPSFATAKVFCMIHDLGLFINNDLFDLDGVQKFANCLMAYHVYCGHHSFYEVMEIYNRQLDYIAWEACSGRVQLSMQNIFSDADNDIPYFDNEHAVERSLPYGHVAKYETFLHASYANKVLISATHYYEQELDLHFSDEESYKL